MTIKPDGNMKLNEFASEKTLKAGGCRQLTHCPYCHGRAIKRGMRKKKYEKNTKIFRGITAKTAEGHSHLR